jgi:valyl-tRNA synthetase
MNFIETFIYLFTKNDFMEEFPKRFEAKQIEQKLVKFWHDNKFFEFDRSDRKKPIFVIDTPPPYPSGEMHIGNVLNWCYIDFVARYKRMRGFNVLFPQGWDVHGLPTEVKVEQKHGIKCSQVSREEWIRLCEEWTNEHIDAMKEMMNRFGFSIDWSTEYKTSDPEYMRMIQLSFLKLPDKGLLYRGKHPINWCPRCETAIADAEVEYVKRKTLLNYIKFKLAGEGEIDIATTRPELLHGCVAIAVNPEDERYRELIGRYAIVPLFDREVEIFACEEVDPEFGTGIVMICTFGDKQDVDWVLKRGLPIIDTLTEDGKLKNAKEFDGLEVEEARKSILEKLKQEGYLLQQEEIEQNVGVCWRCKTPIEILNKEQWFVAVTQLKRNVIRETKNVKWIPEHYALRQINWAESMNWDWVISRQKVYGTPIPVWYCKSCGNIVFAEEKQLPVDPTRDSPPIEKCEKCGEELVGESDTMDTWMDSSLTIAWHAGWPDNFDERLFPADLQPNGADIIRTWDYYLMVRHLALFGKAPYKAVMVNGLVLGEDGRKMSKSLGNFVTAKQALENSCADAVRYWAAIGGAVGSDVPFSWKEVNHGLKFITKIWNISRFAWLHLKNWEVKEPENFEVIDYWILSKLQSLVRDVTNDMENYRFNEALRKIEKFLWSEVADYYLEMIKYRLYSNEKKDAALFTLYKILLNCLKLLSPFMPFVCEEIYQKLFREKEGDDSIAISSWPEYEEKFVNKEAEELGELAKRIIATLRQWKTSRKLSLNTELEKIIISCNRETREKIEKIRGVIQGTIHIHDIEFGEAKEIELEDVKIDVLI